MLLGVRQFFERRGAPTPPLPYDAEVEYIQSGGSQWIDTLVTLTGDSKIEVDFIGLGMGNKAVFGADNGQTFQQGEIAIFWLHPYLEAISPSSNSSSAIIQPRPSYATNTRYVVSYDKTNLVVNGSSQTSGWYADYVGTRTLFIFATNRGSAVVPSDMQLFSFKIYTGSTLVRDMVPVRFTNELGQPEGAMYDRVSGQLFRNAGTGAFTIGPDKS